MKSVKFIILAVLLILTGFEIIGPHYTISEIKTGVIEKDAEKLSDHIDFPKLRQNLKEQINADILKATASDIEENPLMLFAVGLATTLVDGGVDTFITPSSLASFMEGKKPAESIIAPNTNSTKKENLFKNARYTYDSLSKFSIWVPNDSGDETRFVLKREGVSWRLVNMII